MPDSIYNFGCMFAVVKREHSTMTDMELATAVLHVLQNRLGDIPILDFHFIKESIHPLMVGPKGGTPVE